MRLRLPIRRNADAQPRPNYAALDRLHQSRARAYVWLVLKNVLGWLLILGSLVVGPLPSGPIGFPMFIIGFGLVTLPGKRRMTARILYGKPIPPHSKPFQRVVAAVAVVLPAVGIWYLTAKKGYLP